MKESKFSFLKHALVYGLGSVSITLSGFILMPLYTHYMEPAEYGTLQFVYRIGGVFNICLMFSGVRLATLNLCGQKQQEAERKHAAASITLFILVAILVSAVIVISTGPVVASIMSFDNTVLLICGVLAVLVQSVTVMPLAMMESRFESRNFVLTSLGISICHISLVAMTLIVMDWGVWGVLGSIALTQMGFGVGLTLRELRRSSFRPNRNQVKDVALFVTPLVPSSLCFFAMHNADQFMLMKFSGAAALGIYAFGYRLVQAGGTFATEPFSRVWHSWIYRVHERPDSPVLLGRAATRMLAAYVFAVTGLVVFRSEILALMSSSEFFDASLVILPLAVAFFFLSAAHLADASFYVKSETRKKPIVAAISATVTLSLYAIIVPGFGMLGAAYATLLGLAAHCVITLWFAQRVFRVKYEFGRLSILVGSSALVIVVASWIGFGLVGIVLKALLWSIWPVSMWLLGAISQEEQKYALEHWKRVRRTLRRNLAATTAHAD